LVTSYNHYPRPVVFGCPVPEFEQWFFDEENSLKRVFHLNGSDSIPYKELNPKERINKLYEDASKIGLFDFGETIYDIYEKITDGMDLHCLGYGDRSPSFKKFKSDFLNKLRQFQI